MKLIAFAFFLFLSCVIFAQHPSHSVLEPEKYRSETQWSCKDKHFGYYFATYSKPIPIVKSIENVLLSRVFTFGYTYRYKIVDKFDIGVELALQNRKSSINNKDLHLLDPSGFYNKISTFNNSANSGIYFRYNLKGATYRNLGSFIDLGASFDYSFNYGMHYKFKSSSLNQDLRFKNPQYLSPINYSAYVRVGISNFAFLLSYQKQEWINDFSLENLKFDRNYILIGVQMNLYAK